MVRLGEKPGRHRRHLPPSRPLLVVGPTRADLPAPATSLVLAPAVAPPALHAQCAPPPHVWSTASRVHPASASTRALNMASQASAQVRGAACRLVEQLAGRSQRGRHCLTCFARLSMHPPCRVCRVRLTTFVEVHRPAGQRCPLWRLRHRMPSRRRLRGRHMHLHAAQRWRSHKE